MFLGEFLSDYFILSSKKYLSECKYLKIGTGMVHVTESDA
jgi:hypothetical protein